MKHRWHIVSFDNPWPPDYGGAMDVFYKLKYLAEAGVEVRLHFFSYGRQEYAPLKAWAKEIRVYPRPRKPGDLMSVKPFIVQSRERDALLKNLKADDLPILFEGIHTTGFADELTERNMWLRAHNVESRYYRSLGAAEKNPLKKLFFYGEALKLKAYEEKTARKMKGVFAVHPRDRDFFARRNARSVWIPVFHPFDKVEVPAETEAFVLFHGNLSVAENVAAVRYLQEKVMRHLPYDFIVAGKNPARGLEKLKRDKNFRLVPNPSAEKMADLIRRARVHLLYAPQQAGMKLKLLHVLYRGNRVVVNPAMVENTFLEPAVHLARTPEEMREAVRESMRMPKPDEKEIRRRKELLYAYYHNGTNIQKIIDHVEQA